jgi:hypothetical protein
MKSRGLTFTLLAPLLLGGAVLAVTLAGCATPGYYPPPVTPECSGGVCVFRQDIESVRAMCEGFYGERSDACFVPEIKAGWESAPILSPDICDLSTWPEICRQDLFGGY